MIIDARAHNCLKTVLVAPNCMQWGHAVQSTTRMLNVFAEWVMFEADLGNGDSLSRANVFRSGTALISESSRIVSQP